MSEREGAGPGSAEEQLSRRADPRTNTVVQAVLRTGLGLALGFLLAGLVVELASGAHQNISVRMFDLWAPRSVGERIMAVGVLLLTLTPASGVVSVVLSWIRERDLPFIGVGLIVVVVLGAAVVVGLA